MPGRTVYEGTLTLRPENLVPPKKSASVSGYQSGMAPSIPVSSQAPAVARQLVRDAVGTDTDGTRLGDLQLIASELVQNVVRHSSLSPEETFSLTVEVHDDRVRITVKDQGSGFSRGELLPVSEDPWSGRGLILVDSLSSRWGAERSEEGGTTAWAEVDL